ncbi:uncharacterized protein LOC128343998 [Hemicordylus capensis]|uniref:uncharacterized protein LOC128343998 n=1 Tax=Hemicordylus capensis TaxID=884348 RepID=UPI0023032C4E|nr:uncharacterized protein LOC128343998 [Hemicordylus capensis]
MQEVTLFSACVNSFEECGCDSWLSSRSWRSHCREPCCVSCENWSSCDYLKPISGSPRSAYCRVVCFTSSSESGEEETMDGIVLTKPEELDQAEEIDKLVRAFENMHLGDVNVSCISYACTDGSNSNNIVEYQIVGHHHVLLLRSITVKGQNSECVNIVYDKPHYISVSKQHIDIITVQIKSDQDKIMPFCFSKRAEDANAEITVSEEGVREEKRNAHYISLGWRRMEGPEREEKKQMPFPVSRHKMAEAESFTGEADKKAPASWTRQQESAPNHTTDIMKAAAMLVLLALGLWCCFFASGACLSRGPQIDCSDYKKLSDMAKPTRCTLEFFPICGSNGRTYTNKCLFCRAAMASQGKIHFKHYGKC